MTHLHTGITSEPEIAWNSVSVILPRVGDAVNLKKWIFYSLLLQLFVLFGNH